MKYTYYLLILLCVCVAAESQAQNIGLTDTIKSNALDEVVVTGQFAPQSLRKSVYRVRLITNDQIRLRASTNVENILSNQLGVRFSNDLTLGESDIELMGMTGQNVKILVDGVPMIDRGATKQSLSQIDVNNIDRIEVVEGPMSVVYGTDALAGVVNIITKKAESQDNLFVSMRVQEESAGDEYSTFRDEGVHNNNVSIAWIKNGFNATLSGSRNNFGGWQGNSVGRALDWNPKEQWIASGSVGYKNQKSNTWYRLDYLDEDIYSPGVLNELNLRAVDKNYLTSRYTHVLQSNWHINNQLGFSGAVSYQDYERATRTIRHDFQNGTSELTTGDGEQDIAAFTSFIFRGTMHYKVSEMLSFQPGIEIASNKGTGQRIDGEPVINDYAFFVSSEVKPVGWLNLRPGFRFIKNSVYDAPPLIPSLNAKAALSDDFDLRAAYARGFRSPALRELYFVFFDANHSIQGNENLKAEHSDSFNTYLSWHGRKLGNIRLSSTIGGFYNEFDNLIDVGVDAENNSVNTYINIDKFRTIGTLLENRLEWENLTANIGLSYIGRYNRLSEAETHTPSMVWTPEISGDLMCHIPKWQMGVNLFYKFNGERPSYETQVLPGGELTTRRASIAAHHLADLSVNKNINKYVTLIGGVRNLFDVTRITNSSLGGGEAHSEVAGSVPVSYGRSFFLGLNFQWSKN